MRRDGAARLAQQEAAQPVVRAQRLHLLAHARAGRRIDTGDDDVPDLAARVTPDDGDRARGTHASDTIERGVRAGLP